MSRRSPSPQVPTDDLHGMAIYNRPQRERRIAQDFLVENAALYNVSKLFGGNKETGGKKRTRDEEPHTVTTPTEATSEVFPDAAATTLPTTQPERMREAPEAQGTPRKQLLRDTTPTGTPSRRLLTPPPRHGSRPHTPPPSPSQSQEPAMLDVTLATLSHRQVSVRILSTRTVHELAQRVETLLGLPADQVRIRKGSVDLGPAHHTLVSCGVQSGDVLVIRVDPSSAASVTASPFRNRVSLLPPGMSAPRNTPPSPYKEIPSWMKE